MLDLIPPLHHGLRPARYVRADDVLYYARYHNQVAGGRGWSRAVMEENLPGWSLQELIELGARHRLVERTDTGGWQWRAPEVVGAVIDGADVIRDRGDLQHPAKAAAQRRVDVGHTGPYVRHLRCDDSPVILHVRVSAATPDEHLLHDVARAAYHASPVRPSLVLNVSNSLVDPFDPPYAGLAVAGSPLDEAVDGLVRCYNADVVSLLEHERSRHRMVAVVTLALHEGGEPIELTRADATHLPVQLRSNASRIVSKVLSIRADTLLDPLRADTIAALVRLLGDVGSPKLVMRTHQFTVEPDGRATS